MVETLLFLRVICVSENLNIRKSFFYTLSLVILYYIFKILFHSEYLNFYWESMKILHNFSYYLLKQTNKIIILQKKNIYQ